MLETKNTFAKGLISITTIIVIMCFCSFSTADNSQPEKMKGMFSELKVLVDNTDIRALSVDKCTDQVELPDGYILGVCKVSSKDTSDDYGLRLIVVATIDGKKTLVFISNGARDAYSGKISVMQEPVGKDVQLVIIDYSAEYSYGLKLYLKSGGKIVSIGNVNAVLKNDGEAISALPYATIRRHGRDINITFSKKVWLPDANGRYKKYAAGKLKYIYDGSSLKLVKVK